MTQSTTTVVVGAGHSGLAISRHLAARGVDHVVLERGQIAHSWRSQRWDSLRLLTPNWMTRLPGFDYSGDDPDGFLGASEVADLVGDFASSFDAPVQTDTTVTKVSAREGGFVVETDRGPWHAASVVLATGAVRGVLPEVAAGLPDGLDSVHAIDYRNPDQLREGGVLVVGAGASGIQIAEELQRSGREVTLAVGEHVRAPRRYRDKDIFHWIEAAGILDERWDEMDDVARVRRLPSFQLVGGARTVDLNALQDAGVRIVGKLAGIRGDEALLSGSLSNVCNLADLKLNRLLTSIDDVVGGTGERLEPTRVPEPELLLKLTGGQFSTVLWAAGIKSDHSFLDVDVFDSRGRVKHEGGVTSWPGLYVTGLPVLRSRRSTYIDGSSADAEDIVAHLVEGLAQVA